MQAGRVGWAEAPRRLWTESRGLGPAFLLALMLACVLLPLPQWLVDLLLTGSLAFSLTLLVAALRIERADRFLVFPRLVLLVTAFRLVLNLATTRLILAEADAGRVIEAFAGFVTRGDLVVGAVMFAIITAIQWLVITRGTERVAEVAARFALDGMPGRQAAIDADLRAGAISAGEAARRRAALDARSDFYGAMDGAVKFVKGDAVVGLVIVGVNVVGGLILGSTRLGLGFAEALELFGRLAIGDGLLAQLPAVMVSLAAGVLVSRVDGATRETRSWLEPATLIVPAVLLFLVAWVPGMPRTAFALTGLALLGLALALTARASLSEVGTLDRGMQLRLPPTERSRAARWRGVVRGLHRQLEANTGLRLPPLELVFDAEDRGASIRLASGTLVAVRPSVEDVDATALATFRTLVARSETFLDLSTVAGWMEDERRERPAVAKLVAERVQEWELLRALRGMLRERIPLPPPAVVLAAVAETPVFADRAHAARWDEALRRTLAPHWVGLRLDSLGGIDARALVQPTPDLEEALREAHREVQGTWECVLPEARRRDLIDRVQAEFGEGVLVVASDAARAAMAQCLSVADAAICVLSQSEFRQLNVGVDDRFVWLDESILDELSAA